MTPPLGQSLGGFRNYQIYHNAAARQPNPEPRRRALVVGTYGQVTESMRVPLVSPSSVDHRCPVAGSQTPMRI
jgi:hypothetical protein